MLGKRATGFITSVLQVVSSNKLLANADPHSVYHSAAVAATLDLPLNPNLGFSFIVPYNESFKDQAGQWQKRQVAQFQMGYKGYVQLAHRSSLYKAINATDVREGELLEEDRLTGDCSFKWVQNRKERLAMPVIGYASHFGLVNGFQKTRFMAYDEMYEHAKRYSQTFKNDKGRWKDDFEPMALKTVLKLNLSKYGPLSVDMQNAVTFDQAVMKGGVDEPIDISYPDNEAGEEIITDEEIRALFVQNIPILGDQLKEYAHRIVDNKEVDSYAKLAAEINKAKEAAKKNA
jgi:recombination protein RecT